jgi:ribonuclease E
LRKGHEILVQVAKEGLGQKGPALTMYLSIPGRYLVLMPAISRLGVSKRIDDESQRRELKDILNGLKVPDGMGVIVRTAGMGRKREELQRDLDFLLNVWETMKKKAQEYRAPALVYEEGDVVTRVFRDVLTDDVTEIVIDDPAVLERARSYLQAISPGMESRLKLYTGHEPLFHKYNVEPQVQRLFHRKVELKGGGSIVIEQTEALVAIDVNMGRYREKKNQDDTILMTNLVAAREVARQLRLRDIGGLIMIDFIDMDNLEHRRRVERELKMHLARDKARLNVMQISPLGIVEMTRQRVRQSLRKTFFEPCPCCGGTGHVKSIESVGLEILREINDILADRKGSHFRVTLNPDTAFEIINHFRHQWSRMEEKHGARIVADGDESLPVGQWKLWVANEKGDWVLRKSSEVDDYVRNN